MLRNLRISGFRGLREFAMSGLGRVNLLVGTNNCGKTSVLEAAEPGRTEISLQRIERGKVEAIAFTELEIRQAAERGLEVR